MADLADRNQKLKPQTNSELSIDSLISAPLVAASKANAEMMLGQTHFVLRNCFSKRKDETNSYDPVMIQMSLTQSVINNDKNPSEDDYMTIRKINFEVPLFCLIPMNSLAIDKITVDFDMEVTSTSSWNIGDDESQKTGKRVLKKQAQLNGKIKGGSKGDSQYTKDSTSKLKVHINASPLPLPLGMLTILDLYSKNINPSSNSNTNNND
ncbi:DUF2589 domain-containing protein [Ancylomarina sp. DW003]|nr:DUF2589 domain-containing protein [Ancylomarina sp. DW003]MDE5422499.1 DUF2589 domain-containing protein [Ancylomarina sp. DW003]